MKFSFCWGFLIMHSPKVVGKMIHVSLAYGCLYQHSSNSTRFLWSDESTFSNCSWKLWTCVVLAKEPSGLLCNAKFKSQRLWWYGDVLVSTAWLTYIHEGTLNVERYIYFWEKHGLPSKQRVFHEHLSLFQQDNAKPHFACVTTVWLFSKTMWVLVWPAFNPGLSLIENVVMAKWSRLKQ